MIKLTTFSDRDSLVCHEAVAADVDRAAEGDEAAPSAADMDVDDHEGREDGGSAGDAASAVSDEDCELGDDIGMLEDEAFRAVPEEEPDADGREAGGVGMDIDRGGGAGSSGDIGPAGPVPPPPEPAPVPRARGRKQAHWQCCSCPVASSLSMRARRTL